MSGTVTERFWARTAVADPDECWIWRGSKMTFGYGSLSVDGRSARAHRLSWELHNGPIPDGMHVCHHCDNPPCVNPDHLFLGDNAANTRDRDRKARQANSRKTHCVRGHELAGENLYVKPDGYRQCRVCGRARWAAYKARRRHARRAAIADQP